MVNQPNAHRLENVVQEYMKNSAIKFALSIVSMAIEYVLILILGYEVNKIFSDEPKDVSTFVEFFVVLSFCMLIWIMKCCCLNKFCINCCINQIKGKQTEDTTTADELEPKEKVSLMKKIVRTLHMILNRIAVGAVGYEIRKRLFAKEPMNNWDYAEVIAVGLFCVWIFTIKYCILKCYVLKCCCPCLKCGHSQNTVDIEATKKNQNEPKTIPANAGEAESKV